MEFGFRTTLASLILSVAAALPAWAEVVSYDYEFDTPVFSDPKFAPINSTLSAAGPTITGRLSFDTLDVASTSYVDHYTTFSHEGELDDLFQSDASLLIVEQGGVVPLDVLYWGQDDYLLDLYFPASSSGAELVALWFDVGVGGVRGGSTYERQDLVNFRLVPADDSAAVVPVPASFALLFTGIAGFVAQRRMSRRRSTS